MFGLGFLGSIVVLAIGYYFYNKMDKNTKFLAHDIVERSAEVTLCGAHKAMDEIENLISDGKGMDDYKKELVARRLAARNNKG